MPTTIAGSATCRTIPHRVALFTLALFTLAVAACVEEPSLEDASDELTAATYRGWNRWTGACSVDTSLEIFEPSDAGRHPVFIQAIGTGAR